MKNLFKSIVLVATSVAVLSCQSSDVTPELTDVSVAEIPVKVEFSQGEGVLEQESMKSPESADMFSMANSTYSTFPTLNNWTVANNSTDRLSCATFTGGLKSSVISVNGSRITVRIQKNNNSTFGQGGTAYIKALNPCGNVAGSSSWSSSSYYYIDVTFNATFQSGEVTFIPTIQLNNGVRMHSNRIVVKATTSSNVFEKLLVSGRNYKHFCQLSNPHPNRGMSCVPTSYMIARQLVSPNRTFSGTELNRISIGMGLSSQGVSLTSAANFAKADMGNCSNVLASTNLTVSVDYIKQSISANRPLLAVTQLNSNHIVTIVGIKLTGTNTGIIYYIDPLDRDANVRSYNLANFMQSMRNASAYGYHNLLKIGC